MRRAGIVLGLLLCGWSGIAAAQSDSIIPCYTCRAEDCPDLNAPPCPKKAIRQTTKPPRNDHTKPPQSNSTSPARADSASTHDLQGSQPSPGDQAHTPVPMVQVPPPSLRPPGDFIAVQNPIPPPRRHPLRWAGIGTGIGGVLLVGAGATLVAISGRYGVNCWTPGDSTTCPQVYVTTPAGGALLGVGGAALVGATVLLILDARHHDRAIARIQ